MGGLAGGAAEAKTPKGGGIQSLERAGAILDIVAKSPSGIGLTELSNAVSLHTSTVHHLVKTLVALDFLAQDPEGKKYRIGGRVIGLASGALRERALLDFGMPVLEELSAETGEASHLGIRSRDEVLVVARMEGAGMLQMTERIGISRPLHATAIGKALLAHMRPQERDRLIDRLALPPLTPNTITDAAALRAEVEEIGTVGVAHDRMEFDAEMRCIAIPVFDFAGRCIAAMGVSGPVWRMSPEVVEERVAQLRRHARWLSQDLGHREGSGDPAGPD